MRLAEIKGADSRDKVKQEERISYFLKIMMTVGEQE